MHICKKKSPATLARGYLEAKLTLYKKNAFPQEPTIYTASMRIPWNLELRHIIIYLSCSKLNKLDMESFKIFSMCTRSKSDFSTLYKEDCLRIEFHLIFVRRPSSNKSWSGTKDAFSLSCQNIYYRLWNAPLLPFREIL